MKNGAFRPQRPARYAFGVTVPNGRSARVSAEYPLGRVVLVRLGKPLRVGLLRDSGPALNVKGDLDKRAGGNVQFLIYLPDGVVAVRRGAVAPDSRHAVIVILGSHRCISIRSRVARRSGPCQAWFNLRVGGGGGRVLGELALKPLGVELRPCERIPWRRSGSWGGEMACCPVNRYLASSAYPGPPPFHCSQVILILLLMFRKGSPYLL